MRAGTRSKIVPGAHPGWHRRITSSTVSSGGEFGTSAGHRPDAGVAAAGRWNPSLAPAWPGENLQAVWDLPAPLGARLRPSRLAFADGLGRCFRTGAGRRRPWRGRYSSRAAPLFVPPERFPPGPIWRAALETPAIRRKNTPVEPPIRLNPVNQRPGWARWRASDGTRAADQHRDGPPAIEMPSTPPTPVSVMASIRNCPIISTLGALPRALRTADFTRAFRDADQHDVHPRRCPPPAKPRPEIAMGDQADEARDLYRSFWMIWSGVVDGKNR